MMDWTTAFLLIAGIGMAYWMHCTMQREAAIERHLDALTTLVDIHQSRMDVFLGVVYTYQKIRECERKRDAEKEAK
jgi:hypothetical protein